MRGSLEDTTDRGLFKRGTALHFCIYGVMGTHLFGENDPGLFGDLGTSMLTLFQVVTLEGWVDAMKTQLAASSGYGPPPTISSTWSDSRLTFGSRSR